MSDLERRIRYLERLTSDLRRRTDEAAALIGMAVPILQQAERVLSDDVPPELPGPTVPTVAFCGCPAVPTTLDGQDRLHGIAFTATYGSIGFIGGGTSGWTSEVYQGGGNWIRAYLACRTRGSSTEAVVYRRNWATQQEAIDQTVTTVSVQGPAFATPNGVLNSCSPFDFEGTTTTIDFYA